MQRELVGKQAYLSGLAAEAAVARHYGRDGRRVAATRWRGRSGEIDLIVRDGEKVIFVEVKSSRSHDRAALALSRRQLWRIQQTGEEFLGHEPRGRATPCRVDLALVDGMGRIEVIENISMM